MLVDDRRTHIDHVGVLQEKRRAILCLPHALSAYSLGGGVRHILNNFCGPKNAFLAVNTLFKEERQTVFYILTVAGNWGKISNDRPENGDVNFGCHM